MASLSTTLSPILSSNPRFSRPNFRVRASSSSSSNPNPMAKPIRTLSAGIILTAVLSGQLPTPPPSLADPIQRSETLPDQNESISTVDSLKSLLRLKIAAGDHAAALSLLSRLSLLLPSDPQWALLSARLHNDLGHAEQALDLYEEILTVDPGSFEARFERDLLVDRRGDGDDVIACLVSASADARDSRLIAAQVKFLQKEVEEAMEMYAELAEEDPTDYRPWFCQGVICSLIGRRKEAREMFGRYRELVPKKFEIDALSPSEEA